MPEAPIPDSRQEPFEFPFRRVGIGKEAVLNQALVGNTKEVMPHLSEDLVVGHDSIGIWFFHFNDLIPE